MQAPLGCDPSLRQVMTEDFWGSMGGGNQTIQDHFCNATCGNDLATYRSTVKQACAGDPEPLPGYPATYWGDSASAAWNQVCLRDSQTGAYCVGMLGSQILSCPRANEITFKTFLLAFSPALPEIAMEPTCLPTSCARTVSCRYSAPCKVHPTPITTILWLRFGHPFRQLADSHFQSMFHCWKPTSPHQGVLLPLDLVVPVFACPVTHITSSRVITAKSLPRSQTWRPEP
jgi:hypothetical protein